MIIQDDLDGAEKFTEYVIDILPTCRSTKWLVAEYYEHIITIFEHSKDLDPDKIYLDKYKLKLAENVFLHRHYKWSLKLFTQIIEGNKDKSSQKDFVTRCCVCGSLAAILSKGIHARKKLEKFSKLYDDFDQSCQYMLLNKIIEYWQKRDIEMLENTVFLLE
ncbi:hypothetical protein RF11_05927 [Thelohanellus kitauei]|uniref:Uncharacterized protein n=1 Tax=Thelohanellus kitauei TaxID=669202 RepID=A0A0C2IVL0_THEKT|nr:hypothetical protein RF11_05927 [Thelohanellus kitauei]